MPLHRAVAGTAAVPVSVVDALAGHPHPVILDQWPAEKPWDTRPVPAGVARPHALDTYCDPALLSEVVEAVHAFRDASQAGSERWWTAQASAVCSAYPDAPLAASTTTSVPVCEECAATETHGERAAFEDEGLVYRLITNAQNTSTTLAWKKDGQTYNYTLPPRTAFLLTNLLVPHAQELRRPPAGWDQLLPMRACTR